MKVRAIAEARIKTDKIDSMTLAELLRGNLIPAVHVTSADNRDRKNLLRERAFFVKTRTMVKNRIHALIDRHPTKRAERAAEYLFSNSGIEWLKGVTLPRRDRRLMDYQIGLLEYLNGQIGKLEESISRLSLEDARVKLLMTIPGIGKLIGLFVISEIDDINRFRTSAKLNAYAGIIPSTYASGGKVHHGKITRTGNKYLRWGMIEAVWPAIAHDANMREYYDRIAKRKGANSGKTATARRLLTIAYHVLKENREYRHVYR